MPVDNKSVEGLIEMFKNIPVDVLHTDCEGDRAIASGYITSNNASVLAESVIKYLSQQPVPKERIEDTEPYFGWCDVEGCENEGCCGGTCWSETGHWRVCSKHSQQHREGSLQPQMKQAAIDRENSRDENGYLPSKP